jgi:hypothetical protein
VINISWFGDWDFSEDKDSKEFFCIVSFAICEMLNFIDNSLEGLFFPIHFVFRLIKEQFLSICDIFLYVLELFYLKSINVKEFFKDFDFALFFEKISKDSIAFIGEVMPDVSENFENVNFLLPLESVRMFIKFLLQIQSYHGVILV